MSGGTRPRGVLQRRPPTMPDAPGPSPGPSPRLKLRPTVARRLAPLVVVSLAQLMIALDATIVSIALPSAQRALHVSDANRQLVITAYTLAFGGLLLLGGRIADYLGRKRAFLIGLAGFAAASALGGAATNLGMLLAGRALQGAFAAILAPTALSLLAVTFTEPAERARAFAVYGGIAGSGGAAGLLLGGVLTQYLVWRWCLYVNVPIAVIAAAGGWAALPDLRPSGRPRLDIPGALLATGSLAAVVYACTQAVSRGWGAHTVVGLLVAGAVGLALFVAQESRSASPLLPLRIVADRNRGGAFLATALAVVGMFGMFLLLTYYFQVVLRFSPVRAGLAFLPMTAAVVASSAAIASPLLPRVPPRAMASAACSCRSSASPPKESPHTTPGSPRRWSTPQTRSAGRSAPRCSTPSPPAPPPATWPHTREVPPPPPRPRVSSTATPWPSRGALASSRQPRCSPPS